MYLYGTSMYTFASYQIRVYGRRNETKKRITRKANQQSLAARQSGNSITSCSSASRSTERGRWCEGGSDRRDDAVDAIVGGPRPSEAAAPRAMPLPPMPPPSMLPALPVPPMLPALPSCSSPRDGSRPEPREPPPGEPRELSMPPCREPWRE